MDLTIEKAVTLASAGEILELDWGRIVANFHFKAGSPAFNLGKTEPFAPFVDQMGQPRGANSTVGAFQK